MPIQSHPEAAALAPSAPLQATTTPPPAQGPVAAGTPVAQPTGSPSVIYEGLREQRDVLYRQKERILDEREEIVQSLRQGTVSDGDRAGQEQRLAQVDQRLARVNIEIAEVESQVATAAAQPGAIVREPERDPWQNGPPVELVVLGFVLTAVLLFPAALAWARRLWKKANVVSAVPPELTERISAMERNLDAVAVEIERIGEGQRFVTQLLAHRNEPVREALPAAKREG